jgi:hypothetical protein
MLNRKIFVCKKVYCFVSSKTTEVSSIGGKYVRSPVGRFLGVLSPLGPNLQKKLKCFDGKSSKKGQSTFFRVSGGAQCYDVVYDSSYEIVSLKKMWTAVISYGISYEKCIRISYVKSYAIKKAISYTVSYDIIR